MSRYTAKPASSSNRAAVGCTSRLKQRLSAVNIAKINKNVNKMKLINDSINNVLALSQTNVLT